MICIRLLIAAFFLLHTLLCASILYEFRGDSTTPDTTLNWLQESEFLIVNSALDSSKSVRVQLQIDPFYSKRRGKSGTLVKQLPVREISALRFAFSFDSIIVTDTANWARKDLEKGDLPWSFNLFSLFTDMAEKYPFLESLFDLSLVNKSSQWLLRAALYKPAGTALWREKDLCTLSHNTPYCLEYRLVLDRDSTAKHLDIRLNGKTLWKKDLEPLKYRLNRQYLAFQYATKAFISASAIYYDNIAFGTDWLGCPPGRPRPDSHSAGYSRRTPQSVVLYSPRFMPFLTPASHRASQYQIIADTMTWSLPLYDTGPLIKKKDSIRIPLLLLDSTEFFWRIRHFDQFGNRSDWSNPFKLRYAEGSAVPRQTAYPEIHDIQFRSSETGPLLSNIRKETWYHLRIKLSDPKGWENLGYAIIWASNSGYTEGNFYNRGGYFYPQSSYVTNFSFAPTKVFEKINTGSQKTTMITGTQGLYLDAGMESLKYVPADSTINCRIRFLKEAVPGKWTIRGFVRNSFEQASPLFYATILLSEKDLGAVARLPVKWIVLLCLFCFLMLACALGMVKRRNQVKPAALPSREQEIFQKFNKYIGDNLSADLRFEEIEKEMCMSYSNLYRIVKTETGKSIKQYVLERKIEKAGDLLKNTNKNITEIMVDVGFNNPGHFSALFKKHAGLSPTQYREKFRS